MEKVESWKFTGVFILLCSISCGNKVVKLSATFAFHLLSVLVCLRSMRCGTVECGSTFLGTDRRDPPARRDECSTFNFGYLRQRWAFKLQFDRQFLIANHRPGKSRRCVSLKRPRIGNNDWILLVFWNRAANFLPFYSTRFFSSFFPFSLSLSLSLFVFLFLICQSPDLMRIESSHSTSHQSSEKS